MWLIVCCVVGFDLLSGFQHIAVVIMRERFDSTRGKLQPEESKADSGSELLARAKQQLTASGLQVQDHSTQSVRTSFVSAGSSFTQMPRCCPLEATRRSCARS